MDVEGAYVEEFAAIAVNSATLQIVDVFHEFAKAQAVDDWSRKHVHGLNVHWLMENAKYENQTELTHAFQKWLCGKNVLCMFANGPGRERQVLGNRYNVRDLHFLPWSYREKRASHQMTLNFKRSWSPVHNKRCCYEAHSSFRYVPVYRHSSSEEAKRRWGIHCALYDCAEAYFFWVEERGMRSN